MKHIKRAFPERFFIGVELEGGVQPGVPHKIPKLWEVFMNEDIKLLHKDDIIMQFIGLECYPPDFMESRSMDYYAMVQTKEKVEQAGFVTKKLPAGTYISFEIQMDDIMNQIQHVYNYVKNNKIPVHYGFDFEEYIPTEDYTKQGAMLYFSLLLEHHE
jgi:predicted transcriptional regulator YdeE